MTASFPNVTLGSSSSQTITLTNTGKKDLTISQAAVAGSGFTMTGLTTPLTIQGGQSATFNAAFTPGAAGSVTGAITLTSNAPNSPLTIALNGSGVAVTRLLTANPASLSFGDVLVGNTGAASTTLTNSGNSNVTISGAVATGSGFSVTSALANTTLTPSQTMTLNVSFAPTVAGSATGSVTVNSNAISPVVISLGANGTLPTPHTVALTWSPSTSTVTGYNVYRGAAGSGIYAKITATPIVAMQFTDANVVSGQSYDYVVTAVDANNLESIYSNTAAATIP